MSITQLDYYWAKPVVAETAEPGLDVKQLLAPLYQRAEQSESLIGHRYPVHLDGRKYEIPKFLLLGARGGGKPVRLGLFSGLDAGSLESTFAVARLLMQLELNTLLAKDYAVFAYPVVNLKGFDRIPAEYADFQARYRKDSRDEDVRFIKSEMRRWFFDGIIILRSAGGLSRPKAGVRSAVVANEVVRPALHAADVAERGNGFDLVVRCGEPESRLKDHLEGRLTAPLDIRPYPFEIELTVPEESESQTRAGVFYLTILEILRNYRAFIAHAQGI